ncbi:MAG TPA: putative baseplate assembly protein [Actinomycetota bacterium]|nr:putative baseplate assembly protein [Actinomycetota bacterium]
MSGPTGLPARFPIRVANGEPCGACEGITAETPAPIGNRPGLGALAYRSGTWAQFKASLLDALSTEPALAGLRTRSDDDFTIALLDGWSVVCDILTFYQERLANESYLRTATERLSVGELAKLIGYKLRPGLAASTNLAFTIDTPLALPPGPNTPPPGGPPAVLVDAGTRAQSVPDPGAQPATFETAMPINARSAWNAIRLRATRPAAAVADNASADVRLQGLLSTVKAGDMLLVVAGGSSRLQRVAAVGQDTGSQTTLVAFEAGQAQAVQPLPTAPGSAAAGSRLGDAFVRGAVQGRLWQDQGDLTAFALAQGWSLDALEGRINALRMPPGGTAPISTAPVRVFALGTDAAIFGHNAPNHATINLPSPAPPDWEGYTLATIPAPGLPWVDLDTTYPVVVGDRVVLVDGSATAALTVAGVSVLSRAAYLLSGKLTSIRLAGSFPASSFHLRTTRILVQTAEYPVAEVVLDPVQEPGGLMLDGAYLSLAVGQAVAVTGVRADRTGETTSEVATITGLSLVDGYTVLALSPNLAGTYLRASVTINANVAPATHGESVTELLGSGDGSRAFQRFALKSTPLTYVSDTSPSGAASTLVVRVDGVAWSEVPWLYGSGPTDRVYTVLTGADGATWVRFGDGVTGARPGTGKGNIQATYRRGIGTAGLVRAGQISVPLSRPLGLKAVVNPVASSGGADPETIDQARGNAPITVKALGRIVSLEDAADFAAASAGIAKARADLIWDGTRSVVCVTVAGPGAAPVVPGTRQYASLLQAMRDAGDGTLAVSLCDFVPATFTVAATVTPDPARVAADVRAAVKAALAATFSFDRRAFGQHVFRSEVLACIQDVPGVVAVRLTAFHRTGAFSGLFGIPVLDAVAARPPAVGLSGLVGAELLTLETGPLPGVVVAQ